MTTTILTMKQLSKKDYRQLVGTLFRNRLRVVPHFSSGIVGTLRLWTTVSCDGWECVTQQKYQ